MRLVARSWNLFHGRTYPETGRLELARMVRLVTADDPDVVCLQEIPLWALQRLEDWSGMTARGIVTKRALAGPAAAFLQRLSPRLVRSTFTGQANALLVSRRHDVQSSTAYRLNPGAPAEARFCQVIRLRVGGTELLVANVHATTRDPAAARRELETVSELLGSAGPAIACGDFNVAGAGLPGFSSPLLGIDQVLVRGLTLLDAPFAWPDLRRRTEDGVLLSDHTPVEAEMMLSS